MYIIYNSILQINHHNVLKNDSMQINRLIYYNSSTASMLTTTQLGHACRFLVKTLSQILFSLRKRINECRTNKKEKLFNLNSLAFVYAQSAKSHFEGT
jgi:hypothetical protein